MARTPQGKAGSLVLVRQAEEQVLCYRLRLQGYNLRKIAEMMTAQGYPMSHHTVGRRIADEIAERVEPGRVAARYMELDRLDEIFSGVKEKYDRQRARHASDCASRESGACDCAGAVTEETVRMLLSIIDSRRKLLGLDDAVKLDITTRNELPAEPDLGDLMEAAEAALQANSARDEWARERLQR